MGVITVKQNAIDNKSQDLTIDPGASGDSFVQFDINATGEFRIGVDDDAGDAFKVSQGSALGTNDTFIMTAAGERTMPLQPAFFARLDATATDVTGGGTTYTIIFNAEIFDQNGDYNNGTGSFTSPIDGKYMFLTTISYVPELTTGGDQVTSTIVTSNGSFRGTALPTRNRVTNFYSVGSSIGHITSQLCDMDNADTAHITILGSGGADNDDIAGGSTFYSGYLAC